MSSTKTKAKENNPADVTADSIKLPVPYSTIAEQIIRGTFGLCAVLWGGWYDAVHYPESLDSWSGFVMGWIAIIGAIVIIKAIVSVIRKAPRWKDRPYYFCLDQNGKVYLRDRLYAGGFLDFDKNENPLFIEGVFFKLWNHGRRKSHAILFVGNRYEHPSNPFAAPEQGDYRLERSAWKILHVDFRNMRQGIQPHIQLTDSTNPVIRAVYHEWVVQALYRINREGGIVELTSRLKKAEEALDPLGRLIVGTIDDMAKEAAEGHCSKLVERHRKRLEQGLDAITLPDRETILARWRKEIALNREVGSMTEATVVGHQI